MAPPVGGGPTGGAMFPLQTEPDPSGPSQIHLGWPYQRQTAPNNMAARILGLRKSLKVNPLRTRSCNRGSSTFKRQVELILKHKNVNWLWKVSRYIIKIHTLVWTLTIRMWKTKTIGCIYYRQHSSLGRSTWNKDTLTSGRSLRVEQGGKQGGGRWSLERTCIWEPSVIHTLLIAMQLRSIQSLGHSTKRRGALCGVFVSES